MRKVATLKDATSWVHSKHLIPVSSQVPLLLHSLIRVKFEAGMLMRYPTEEDLRMRLPQTPPAYMALLPSFPSFILHFPFTPCSSLSSRIIDLQKPQTSPAFFSSFLSICRLEIACDRPSVCFSLHPRLLRCFPAPPSYQTTEPTINAISFWWGNKWNSSWERAAGAEQRLPCDSDSTCPPLTTPGRYHLQTHTAWFGRPLEFGIMLHYNLKCDLIFKWHLFIHLMWEIMQSKVFVRECGALIRSVMCPQTFPSSLLVYPHGFAQVVVLLVLSEE